jgi:tryptophanyl-tRNA synthetase
MRIRSLTGITTTGSPHLGNYVGAIRPAINASLRADTTSFYFLADYHALIKCTDPARIQRSTLEIAASWIALGLDPDRVYFYRQSDIPEIPELTWLLTCVTGKGLLNRAHAYKAAVDANIAAGEDADASITAGLYGYPVLMAADILMFGADQVPVGRDQVQHIEIARDIAQRFNHLYGQDYFSLPSAVVEPETAVLPGLDGRKMSKSYDNTIPLWLSSSALHTAVGQVITNSKARDEAKFPDESALFPIYQAFATKAEYQQLLSDAAAGLGWGEIKTRCVGVIESALAPARTHYQALIENPNRLEDLLQAGADKARQISMPFMRELKHAVGLRSLHNLQAAPEKAAAKKRAKLITFRDSEGYRFKLTHADAKTVLLESIAYADARACGLAMAALKAGKAQLRAFEAGTELVLEELVIANGATDVPSCATALAELAQTD